MSSKNFNWYSILIRSKNLMWNLPEWVLVTYGDCWEFHRWHILHLNIHIGFILKVLFCSHCDLYQEEDQSSKKTEYPENSAGQNIENIVEATHFNMNNCITKLHWCAQMNCNLIINSLSIYCCCFSKGNFEAGRNKHILLCKTFAGETTEQHKQDTNCPSYHWYSDCTVSFNSQGHIRTGSQSGHLWESNRSDSLWLDANFAYH